MDINNRTSSSDTRRTKVLRRGSSTSSMSKLDILENERDPLKERAMKAILSHQCYPHSIKISHSLKMLEEKASFFGGKKKSSSFTTYVLNVSGLERPFEATWSIRRRFSDFRYLKSNLKAAGFKNLPSLPRRRLAGSTAAVVIEERKKGITLFVDKLIDNRNIRESDIFLKFVSTDAMDINVV